MFYKSSLTSKRIFSKLCKKNVKFFLTHVFLRVFMRKCSPPKWVFPSINQCRNKVLIVLHLGCKIPIRLKPNRCESILAIASTPAQQGPRAVPRMYVSKYHMCSCKVSTMCGQQKRQPVGTDRQAKRHQLVKESQSFGRTKSTYPLSLSFKTDGVKLFF